MTSSRRADGALPSVVFLYDDPSSSGFKIEEIFDFLKERIPGIDVELREDFFSFHRKDVDQLASEIAVTKLRSMEGTHRGTEPLYGEIEFEKKLLGEPEKRLLGILYDGFRLQKVYKESIPEEELDTEYAHIAFTNRIFCTLEKGDSRYHARVIICGYPSLISTSGVVEAPAKPKEFYLMKQKYAIVGAEPPMEELKAAFEGRFIDYDDENLTQALKGYAMQALFYHATGEPFCDDRNCILFNAHWQEELINAQIVSGELCSAHENKLRELIEGRRK